MNLRAKLLLSFSIFVIAIIALGAWSARQINQLGEVAERIIANNYDSVVAAQDMKESLERMDSAALFSLLGNRERAARQFAEHQARFNQAFERAANNITEPNEREIISGINREREIYFQSFDESQKRIAAGSDNTSATYFETIEPQFNRLRANCDELLRLNQTAMLDKSDIAEQTADAWFNQMLLLVALLTAIGIWLGIFLSNRIVRPVQALTQTTAQLAGGNLNARAGTNSRDEIGLLAAEFNRMAERLRQTRRTDKGQLIIANAIADKTLNALDDPLLVFDTGGIATKFNHAAEKRFAQDGNIIGRGLNDFDFASSITLAISSALETNQAISLGETQIFNRHHNQQSNTLYRVRVTPVIDAENASLGAVALFEDVSHIQQLGEDKAAFIRDVVTKLQTPLTQARTGLHVLLNEAAGELNATQLDIFHAVKIDCDSIDETLAGFRIGD